AILDQSLELRAPGEASQLDSAVDVRVFYGIRELLVHPVTVPAELPAGFLRHLQHRALVWRVRDLLRCFLRRHVVLDDSIRRRGVAGSWATTSEPMLHCPETIANAGG